MPQLRDQFGRFLPGTTAGPGRPRKPRNPAYLRMVEEVVSLEDWQEILERFKRYALGGDLDALKFLAPYLLGRPATAAPEHDENENANPNPSPNSLPSHLTEPPAQVSGALLESPSQQVERENQNHDGPIAITMNKHLVLKKPY